MSIVCYFDLTNCDNTIAENTFRNSHLFQPWTYYEVSKRSVHTVSTTSGNGQLVTDLTGSSRQPWQELHKHCAVQCLKQLYILDIISAFLDFQTISHIFPIISLPEVDERGILPVATGEIEKIPVFMYLLHISVLLMYTIYNLTRIDAFHRLDKSNSITNSLGYIPAITRCSLI